MILSRTLAACLVACVVLAPLARADAARVRGARHLTFPASVAGEQATGVGARTHRAYATQSDVGSAGDVTADPPVARPYGAPCVDTLFGNASFAAYAGQTFAYAPPAGCPGPYEKIVFNGDFSVSAGVQFDRTASVQIGNVPIYFGTTAEPRRSVAPTWHVERDVTDDAALLATPQTTEADIFNIVNSTYTGVITGSAYMQFYPARNRFTAAATPDVVLPVPGVPGGPQHVNTSADRLAATYTLPTNVVRAYLDVYSQGQQNDEFYYTCAPSDVAAVLFECGNGPLRETEVTIDGTPAGAAPVTPWIFTGGLDPYLWAPIPGAETLEFKPYRVDLTPFAGILSNGKPHTIAISVDNADGYFQGFATFYAYRDGGSKPVTGAVTKNTLAPAAVATVNESLTGTSPSIDGSISVASTRSYEIDGYVNTSRGRVSTTLRSELDFSDSQTYANESATTGANVYTVGTTADTTVFTSSLFGGFNYARSYVSYPLSISIASFLDATISGSQVTSIDQKIVRAKANFGTGGFYANYASNEVKPADTLLVTGGGISGHTGQSSSQQYQAYDLTGACYNQTVAAVAGVVTSVRNASCDRDDARKLRALMHR